MKKNAEGFSEKVLIYVLLCCNLNAYLVLNMYFCPAF